jgi:predicted aspartyl protease
MVQRFPTPAKPGNLMGEVRTKVKLTNAVDEDLMQRGLLNPNLLRTYETEALIDPQSVRTVLPEAVVQQLGLHIRRHQTIQFTNGTQALVGLGEPVVIELKERETIEAVFVAGNTVLIGRTVLATLDLQIDTQNQRLIPNPQHPDYSVLRI